MKNLWFSLVFAMTTLSMGALADVEYASYECAISIDVESSEVTRDHIVNFLKSVGEVTFRSKPFFGFESKVTAEFPGVGVTQVFPGTRLVVILKLDSVPVAERKRLEVPGLVNVVRGAFGQESFRENTVVGICARELRDARSSDLVQLVNVWHPNDGWPSLR